MLYVTSSIIYSHSDSEAHFKFDARNEKVNSLPSEDIIAMTTPNCCRDMIILNSG